MVQKVFGIYRETSAPCQLTIEAGKEHLACWQTIIESGKIFAFELFRYEKKQQEEFAPVFDMIKQQSRLLHLYFPDVRIVWQHEICVCVPEELYNEQAADEYLNITFGKNNMALTKSTAIGGMILHYRISNAAQNLLQQYFPDATSLHKYHLLITEWLAKEDDLPADFIQLLFYEHHFILMAVKQSQLQLINSFNYQTPEDVLYHILNVCERLAMNKEQTHFHFSGLIDVQSNLFKELELYMSNMSTSNAPAEILAADGFQEFPSHYFSSFLNFFK